MLVIPLSVHLTIRKLPTHLHPPTPDWEIPLNGVPIGSIAYSLGPVEMGASAWGLEAALCSS